MGRARVFITASTGVPFYCPTGDCMCLDTLLQHQTPDLGLFGSTYQGHWAYYISANSAGGSLRHPTVHETTNPSIFYIL
jgi:hypothetical protein